MALNRLRVEHPLGFKTILIAKSVIIPVDKARERDMKSRQIVIYGKLPNCSGHGSDGFQHISESTGRFFLRFVHSLTVQKALRRVKTLQGDGAKLR